MCILPGMKPATICNEILGKDKTAAVLDELSSPQIKAVLKEGAVKVKVTGGYVSRQKKRRVWSTRVTSAIAEGENHEMAAELLQQWLLNHRRPLLIAFLDALEVPHNLGETDESFLLSRSKDRVHAAATLLVQGHDRQEVEAYLRYISYQQRTKVLDDWEGF